MSKPEPLSPFVPGPNVDVTISTADAIGVGYSLLAQVKAGKIPTVASAPYLRVAERLIAAAKAQGGYK